MKGYVSLMVFAKIWILMNRRTHTSIFVYVYHLNMEHVTRRYKCICNAGDMLYITTYTYVRLFINSTDYYLMS